MSARELILLSPYTLSTQNPLTLSDEDVTDWCNAFSTLWHPAALWRAKGPPHCASAYDHEKPHACAVYALPDSPPLYLPEDWDQRVRDAGSCAFRSMPDRPATVAALLESLKPQLSDDERERLLSLSDEQLAPFFALGFGFAIESALCEAMEHENLLAREEFWHDLQCAVAALCGLPKPDSPAGALAETSAAPYDPDSPVDGQTRNEPITPIPEAGSAPPKDHWPEEFRHHLQAAADKLLSAREVLYPVPIHLLDLTLFDEQHLEEPIALQKGLPANVLASSALFQQLASTELRRERLRQAVAEERLDVCGGVWEEREDALLPIDSQLWNLRRGLAAARELIGRDVQVYARRRYAWHPQVPLLLNNVGLHRALMISFDQAPLPAFSSTVINWPAQDGKQVEAFVRKPLPADRPQTFFNLANALLKTIREDHSATVFLFHDGKPPAPWFGDWLELSRFAPVLGQWTTFSRYLNEVLPGDHASPLSADEFHSDYLIERTESSRRQPISAFARQLRRRRRLDSVATLAAMQRGLAGANDPLRLEAEVAKMENTLEAAGLDGDDTQVEAGLTRLEQHVMGSLAERLQSRAAESQPGYLVLNPCGFIRRVALELEGAKRPLTTSGPVKACQSDGNTLRVVVEVPALGFAWFPASGPLDSVAHTSHMRLGDETGVRNEFFEAEIDGTTGGLRAIRDHRTRINRVGQRLVFNPGSTMRATAIKTTSTGPALGEIVTEGEIVGEQGQVLATFRQRFRAWLGRPVLEMRIEILPHQPPAGQPWHAYYGARFAWRDERATLARGVQGSGHVTLQSRPQTPDYLELRVGRQNTVLFPNGLPFHQRRDARMLDVLLVTEHETARAFELGLALDREQPMQTALGLSSPVPWVATAKGPPHIGATGWLYHLDTAHLLLLGMRPGGVEVHHAETGQRREATDALTVRLLECANYGAQAEFRCARNPLRATLQDARGVTQMQANVQGDAVLFDVPPGDLVHLLVEFT
jgi:hypothetical protein